MNRTTTVVVALIVAAGLSTMVYAVPAQRALAHHLSPDFTDADVIPFGANSPDPSVSASLNFAKSEITATTYWLVKTLNYVYCYIHRILCILSNHS